jgi:hypothetical protein
VAVAAQRAAASSGVHAPPSPVVAKGLLAATANLAVAVPSIAPATIPAFGPYRLRPDNLGESALSLALLLDSGVFFEDLCVCYRGDSCLANTTLLPHSAAPILAALWSTGAPANLSSDQWTEAQRDAAAQHGPHKGTNEQIEFMRTEFFDMISAGQWLVLPYRTVRQLPNLRLLPTVVVPQRDRRPRPNVDYTFSAVNDATLLQFGTALLRFLERMPTLRMWLMMVTGSLVGISGALSPLLEWGAGFGPARLPTAGSMVQSTARRVLCRQG